MDPYFADLGLKQSPGLILQKYKDSTQYKKFLRSIPSKQKKPKVSVAPKNKKTKKK
jgi:hypothetical protein